jgi:hypothetical protein
MTLTHRRTRLAFSRWLISSCPFNGDETGVQVAAPGKAMLAREPVTSAPADVPREAATPEREAGRVTAGLAQKRHAQLVAAAATRKPQETVLEVAAAQKAAHLVDDERQQRAAVLLDALEEGRQVHGDDETMLTRSDVAM